MLVLLEGVFDRVCPGAYMVLVLKLSAISFATYYLTVLDLLTTPILCLHVNLAVKIVFFYRDATTITS